MESKTRRSAANRAHYERTKDRHDAVLLRLDRGDLAKLDAAAKLVGLSRSAFVKLHLLPAAEALSTRASAIDAAMRARRISLRTFVAVAVDAELAPRAAQPLAADACAQEFDALFSGRPGEDA